MLAQPLWERDTDGMPIYDRPVDPCPPRESRVIRLADRLKERSVAPPPIETRVSKDVMTAITVASEIAAAKVREDMPDHAALIRAGIAEMVREMFGIDMTNKEAVEEVRNDQRFTRAWRVRTNTLWGHAMLCFVGLLVAAMGMAVWSAVKAPSPAPAYYPTVNPATGRP